MKKDIYIAIVSFVIFTTVNALGGLINDNLGYDFGLDQVIEGVPLFIIFGTLYVICSLLKIRLRKSLRIPIIRAIVWLVFAIPLFTNSCNAMATGDFIDAVIPAFCFLINTIEIYLNKISWLVEIRFTLWGVLILGVSLYQFIVLELSTLIVNKTTAYKKV